MAVFTNQSKNSVSYSNQSKNSAIWDVLGSQLLLQENGYYILQEDSVEGSFSRLILEESSNVSPATWTNLIKD